MGKHTAAVVGALALTAAHAENVPADADIIAPAEVAPPVAPPVVEPTTHTGLGFPSLTGLAFPALPKSLGQLTALTNALTPTKLPLAPALVGGLPQGLPSGGLDLDRLMAFLPSVQNTPLKDIPNIQGIYAQAHSAVLGALNPLEGKIPGARLLDGAIDQAVALSLEEMFDTVDNIALFDGTFPDMKSFSIPDLLVVPAVVDPAKLIGGSPLIALDLIPNPQGLPVGTPLENMPSLNEIHSIFSAPLQLKGAVKGGKLLMKTLPLAAVPAAADLISTFDVLDGMPNLDLVNSVSGLERNVIGLRQFLAADKKNPLAGLTAIIPDGDLSTLSLPGSLSTLSLPGAPLPQVEIFESIPRDLLPTPGLQALPQFPQISSDIREQVEGAVATAMNGIPNARVVDGAIDEISAMVTEKIFKGIDLPTFNGVLPDMPSFELPTMSVFPVLMKDGLSALDIIALPAIPTAAFNDMLTSGLKLKGNVLDGKLSLLALPKQLKLGFLSDAFKGLSAIPALKLNLTDDLLETNTFLLRSALGNTGDKNYILRSLNLAPEMEDGESSDEENTSATTGPTDGMNLSDDMNSSDGMNSPDDMNSSHDMNAPNDPNAPDGANTSDNNETPRATTETADDSDDVTAAPGPTLQSVVQNAMARAGLSGTRAGGAVGTASGAARNAANRASDAASQATNSLANMMSGKMGMNQLADATRNIAQALENMRLPGSPFDNMFGTSIEDLMKDLGASPLELPKDDRLSTLVGIDGDKIPNFDGITDEIFEATVNALTAITPPTGDVRFVNAAFDEVQALVFDRVMKDVDLPNFGGVLPDMPSFDLPALRVVPAFLGADGPAVLDLIAPTVLPDVPNLENALGSLVQLKGQIVDGKLSLAAAPALIKSGLKIDALQTAFGNLRQLPGLETLSTTFDKAENNVANIREFLNNTGDFNYIQTITGAGKGNLREPSQSRRLGSAILDLIGGAF